MVVTTSIKYAAFFTFIALFYQSHALRCNRGYELTAELLPPQTVWEEIECLGNETQRCIRGEGIITTFGVNADFVSGTCVALSSCALSCDELLGTILGSDEAAAGGSQFEVSSCNRICCDTDNCNRNTVSQIQQSSVTTDITSQRLPSISPSSSILSAETPQSAVTTATNEEILMTNATLPTAPPEVLLQCQVGYQVKKEKILSNYNSQVCPPNANYACMSQQLKVQSDDKNPVTITLAKCSNPGNCVDECQTVADVNIGTLIPDGVLEEGPYMISSCKQSCCQYNLCNDQFTSTDDGNAGSHAEDVIPSQTLNLVFAITSFIVLSMI